MKKVGDRLMIEDEELLLNILSLMTSLAEDPEVKKYCLYNLEKISHLEYKIVFSNTAEYIKIFFEEIKWKP